MSAVTNEFVGGLLGETVPGIDWLSLGGDESLEDAGLDSLDKATFFMKLEEATGVAIPDEVYEKIDTINAVIAYLKQA